MGIGLPADHVVRKGTVESAAFILRAPYTGGLRPPGDFPFWGDRETIDVRLMGDNEFRPRDAGPLLVRLTHARAAPRDQYARWRDLGPGTDGHALLLAAGATEDYGPFLDYPAETAETRRQNPAVVQAIIHEFNPRRRK